MDDDSRTDIFIANAWQKLHSGSEMTGHRNAEPSALVEPMASAAGANEALKLVGLHPNEFVYSLVAPDLKALSSEFHGTPWIHMKPIACWR